MVQEVAVDRNLCAINRKRSETQPFVINMIGRHPGCPLAKEHDVGHHGGSFPFEGVRWQPDRSDEVRLHLQVFADGGILLVERVMGRDEGQHAAGLKGVDRLGEEVIVQGKLLAVIVELEVGEGHVADHRVNAVLGQLGVAEVLDADVVFGVERLGDAAGNGVEFDADEAHPFLALAHEIAGAAAGLQDGGILGYAQAGNRLVDGRNHGGRRIEGVEGGAFGAVVFHGT